MKNVLQSFQKRKNYWYVVDQNQSDALKVPES